MSLVGWLLLHIYQTLIVLLLHIQFYLCNLVIPYVEIKTRIAKSSVMTCQLFAILESVLWACQWA